MMSRIFRACPFCLPFVAVLLLGMTGCQSRPMTSVTSTAPVPPPTTSPRPQAMAQPQPAAQPPRTPISRSRVTRQYIPGGTPETSAILIVSELPPEIVRGRPFTYNLQVTNLTDQPLYQVTVTEELNDAFQLRGSRPEAQSTGSLVVWNLGVLEPRASKSLQADLVGTEGGTFQQCLRVTTASELCQEIPVTAPQLTVSKELPEEVLSCEDIPITIVVSNSGTGTIRNISVSETLPAGLRTTDGQQLIRFSIEELRGGQSIHRSLLARASQPGVYEARTLAVSENDFQAEAADRVVVRQPVLSLDSRGTDKQFQGRLLRYEHTITNTGDGPARNVTLVNALPQGATFSTATENGQHSAGTVTWQLGTLEPGDSRTVRLEASADRISQLVNTVRANAVCAEQASASVTSDVSGVAAMLLEVVDLDDPIEVGEQSVYEIVVINQGTANATGVAIAATLDESQSYVSSDGSTQGRMEGKRVVFAPLPVLAPGKKALWRVRIQAGQVADARFAIEMTTDQLLRPVRETEATQQY